MRTNAILMAVALLAGLPVHSVAQQAPAPPERYNVVSLNPFLVLATWFNIEYERRLSPTFTAGIRGSHVRFGWDDDDDEFRYDNGRLFGRYYPRAAFRGFFVGMDTGITRVDAVADDASDDADTAFAIGFELGYNWLLGSDRRLYLSLGIGADRLFGNDVEDAAGFLPTARVLNVGIAF